MGSDAARRGGAVGRRRAHPSRPVGTRAGQRPTARRPRSGREPRNGSERQRADQCANADVGRRGAASAPGRRQCRGRGLCRRPADRGDRHPARRRGAGPTRTAATPAESSARRFGLRHRDLCHRLRQGRGGQVHDLGQPRGGTGSGRAAGGRPGRRRVGLLDPRHSSSSSATCTGGHSTSFWWTRRPALET